MAGQRALARYVTLGRRQSRLHRQPDRRLHADPRYEPDPGAQAPPAGTRDQPPDVALGHHSENAIPFTEAAHPYVLEFDEYTASFRAGDSDQVGAGRIIDISNERKPHV